MSTTLKQWKMCSVIFLGSFAGGVVPLAIGGIGMHQTLSEFDRNLGQLDILADSFHQLRAGTQKLNGASDSIDQSLDDINKRMNKINGNLDRARGNIDATNRNLQRQKCLLRNDCI